MKEKRRRRRRRGGSSEVGKEADGGRRGDTAWLELVRVILVALFWLLVRRFPATATTLFDCMLKKRDPPAMQPLWGLSFSSRNKKLKFDWPQMKKDGGVKGGKGSQPPLFCNFFLLLYVSCQDSFAIYPSAGRCRRCLPIQAFVAWSAGATKPPCLSYLARISRERASALM